MPAGEAQRVIEQLVGAERVRVESGTLIVDVDPGRAGELSRALVLAGVEVEEIATRRRSLEEVFFELTGRQTAAEGSVQDSVG